MPSVLWTTADEINFLKFIGEHRCNDRKQTVTPQEKITLLEKYLSAARNRHEWGEIDRTEVLTYARQYIYRIEQALAKKAARQASAQRHQVGAV